MLNTKVMLLNKYLDTGVEDASKAAVVEGTDNSLSLLRGKVVVCFLSGLFVQTQA